MTTILRRTIHRSALFFVAVIIMMTALNAQAEAPVSAAAQKIFNAKSFTLENGLQLVVVENHRAPVITHMVWYRVGAADEPVGKSGIAHFLEHLLFKGQSDPHLGEIPPGEFSKIIRARGGEDNAFTSQDYTAYYQSIASEHLELVMTMEAGRMRGLNPPLSEVESENLVILEERRQRTDNDPKAQMMEQMNEAVFPNHPYAKPIIGWFHEMKSLTWDDAKAFYDLHYAPNNAIVVVSGDIKAEDVLEVAKRTYGLMEKREIPARNRSSSPPFIASSSVTLHHETVREPVFIRTYRAPSYRQNAQESLALSILEEIIGSGPPSRLYKSLVVEKKFATSIGFHYDSSAWDDGTMEIVAVPVEDHDLESLKNAIDAQLRNVVKKGVTEEEFNDALKRMQASAIYARDSLTGPAMIIGYNMITGSTLDDVEYWPRNLSKITREQVWDVAKKYLDPDAPYIQPPVEGYLLPAENKPEAEGETAADAAKENKAEAADKGDKK